MTTQVEKAVPEPVAEPQPHASPSRSQAFNEEMLSPVSKLERARKFAAEEQERRVAAACERMVVVKKAQLVKKMEIEAHLETHIEQQYESEAKRGGRLSSITRRLVDAFKTTTDEIAADPTHKQDGDEETTSPTRKLLQATRTKLNALASKNEGEDAADLPATNYHLKQLGLANEKINIYAPLHEQQSEIRRRRESAIRCQEKYMQDNAEYSVDDGYKSAEDSDFSPDADEEESESDSDDDESEVDVDENELRALISDQSEFHQSVAALKKHKRQVKKAVRSPVSIIGAIVALLLAIALAVFIAEQQSGFCRALVAQEPRAEEPRIATCSVVLQLQDRFLRVFRAATFQA